MKTHENKLAASPDMSQYLSYNSLLRGDWPRYAPDLSAQPVPAQSVMIATYSPWTWLHVAPHLWGSNMVHPDPAVLT